MATEIKIQDIIDRHFGTVNDFNHAADYNLFRTIEEWCIANIHTGRWRFDHSSTTCVCGIDIPGRIIFRHEEDLLVFKLKFGC